MGTGTCPSILTLFLPQSEVVPSQAHTDPRWQTLTGPTGRPLSCSDYLILAASASLDPQLCLLDLGNLSPCTTTQKQSLIFVLFIFDKKKPCIQMVSDFMVVQLAIFQLYNGAKVKHSVKTSCSPASSEDRYCWAGCCHISINQQLILVQCFDHSSGPHLQLCMLMAHTHTNILLSLSVQHSINYTR